MKRLRSIVDRHRFRRVALAGAVLGALVVLAVVVTAYSVPLPQRLHARDSIVVEYQDGRSAYVFLSEDDKWRVPVRLDEVDPAFVDALLHFEDKRFRTHLGVDPFAILRAASSNALAGRRVSGASTITMQLVRLLEPRPRTYASKLIEAFRAVQLEAHLSKDEILEAYLRFAPYGRNIEGIDAAAMAYFGHRATALTPAEIATLLAVPQSPNARYPRAANSNRLQVARDDIAGRLLEDGLLPRGEGDGRLGAKAIHDQIIASRVPAELRAFPREMPHVAFWARAHAPEAHRIRTTIDAGLQTIAERTLRGWRDDANLSDIDHGAAILLDHTTGEVRAAVGNFDFDAGIPGAQIAAFDVPRSPGSLMKPFIYAMAIDRGLAHPRTLVTDVPLLAGTYAPENYDGRFDGLVRLEDALSRSLNVPFVDLLRELGLQSFLATLERMDASHLDMTPGHYGLSAAIGGVDVTALEVAGMYGTLAAEGQFTRPTLIARESHESWKVFTPEAAWLTRRTLEIRDRPDFKYRRRFNPNVGRIHWKTGTSYGHRDAWAAGSSRHFTGVVWMGNLDNRGSNALVGATRSGPVLFDLLEAVEFGDVAAEPRPEGLAQVAVCAYSGHLPGPACEETREVWAPRASVPPTKCPYHAHVDIERASGLALTPECRAGRDYERRAFVVWPASVRRHISSRLRATHRVPPFAPGCEETVRGTPPVITSPPDGQRFVLMPGVDATEQEIPLSADSSHASSTLNWFVDGEFVGSASAQEDVWWTPKVGRHEVVVTDAAGRSARRVLEVNRALARNTVN